MAPTVRHPNVERLFVDFPGSGSGFRAGFREWRFGIPMDHFGEADSAHGAILRAATHMAVVNDTPEEVAKLLREIAEEVEAEGRQVRTKAPSTKVSGVGSLLEGGSYLCQVSYDIAVTFPMAQEPGHAEGSMRGPSDFLREAIMSSDLEILTVDDRKMKVFITEVTDDVAAITISGFRFG